MTTLEFVKVELNWIEAKLVTHQAGEAKQQQKWDFLPSLELA